MKQTRNALGMLLKAYRAIFAHAWKCGLAACALGAGLATAGIASAEVVIDTTGENGTISITDEDQDKYVGETITINGDDKNFLENQQITPR